MRFHLGVHHASWLANAGVPLCVARHRMPKKRFPRAVAPWVLDSGAFTHIESHGRWLVATEDYAEEVRRLTTEIGMLEWAAILDWPCGPPVLAKTGRTVLDHQLFTIDSFLRLRAFAPEVPWLPVLQGWDLEDYERHVQLYREVGVELLDEPVVGLGSIAARQHKPEAAAIVRAIAGLGLRLHGFGVKLRGLAAFGGHLASADSMAWSLDAWKSRIRLESCSHAAKNCANCLTFALQWRERVVAQLPHHSSTFLREMETF